MALTNDLVYWILERENMRIRKEEDQSEFDQPETWKYGYSDDPAMGTVRYCNVRREDDKVTRWIATHWRNPNAKSPSLVLGMVMARMINWPDTLAKLGFPGTGGIPTTTLEWLDSARRQMKSIEGKKWTSAYTISTCGRKMDKEDYVFEHVLPQVAAMQREIYHAAAVAPLLDYAHKQLMSVDGLGSFLAAQVVADLKNTPGHPLSEATDFWTWSAHGPGSMRGLEAYHGFRVTPSNYAKAIEQCYNDVAPLVEPTVGRLHMQDFQNCMCEFSKYIRVKDGDGRVRNKYSPG
ncbi:MAG TPA: nucleotide kinase domain-containing protein [Anaerolineales bacterium]